MASAVAQGGSVSSVGSVDAYTPHLKRVLKSYRAAATTSLHGPNDVRWSAGPPGEKEEDDDSLSPLLLNSSSNSASDSAKFTATAGNSAAGCAAAERVEGADAGPGAKGAAAVATVPRPPSATRPAIAQQPPPLLLPLPTDRKSSGQRTSTLLEGELIASFNVGGEERLCLPQIFNTVLQNFSLIQIHAVCDDFQIYCSQCTDDQLAQLKEASILPFTTTSCGLIKRSDAERVCSLLLHVPVTPEQLRGVHARTSEDLLAKSEANGIAVYHECFGGCQGLLFVDLYVSPVSPCVQCRECRGYLSPRNFISHDHRTRAETRTCHWGFSSANWRQYLLRRDESDECAQQKLESLKTKFDKRKKRPSESCKSITSGSTQGSLAPSPIGDEDENFVKNDEEKSDEICLAKKQRFIEEHDFPEMPYLPPSMEHGAPHPLQAHQYPFVSLGVDPTMGWYQWAASAASAARTSAFKPWQTDLCGLLVGSGKPVVAPGASTGALPGAIPASPTHATKSTHKLIVAGHSNSLDSAEDALSCTSSASERVAEAEDPRVAGGVQTYLGDVSGLQRVLDHHKLDCKVQKDVLHEAMKIIYEYQQVVTSLVKQKHILEKELAHRVRADEKYPDLIRVKEEPIDEHGDQTLGSEIVNSKKHRNVSPDPKLKGASDSTPALLREPQSLIKA